MAKVDCFLACLLFVDLTLTNLYVLDDKIAEMERHLKSLSEKLETMKATKKKEKSDKKAVPKPSPEKPKPKVVPSLPREPSKTTEKKKPTKRSEPRYTSSDDEDDVPRITFEQKRELSERINEFEGHQLANVVQIIHDSMPHLRDVSIGFQCTYCFLSLCPPSNGLTALALVLCVLIL